MSTLATRHEPIISETLWTHRHRNSELDNELLISLTDFREKLSGKVNLAIKSSTSVQERNDAIEDAYQSMFRTDNDSLEDQKQKSLEFLRTVDKSTGSDLEQIARGFISQTAPGFVDVKIRFVVEAALVLAKQRLKKPQFPIKGTLLPNIRFNQNGSDILAAQIDGAIVQAGDKVLIKKSKMARHWTQVEIKSYHDIEWTIANSPSPTPHKIHLDQFHQRLEALYILCQEKGIDFTLPSHIIFCYLRGLKDDVFYTIPIGISHLAQWISDIEARSFRENRQPTKNEKKILKYLGKEEKRQQNKLDKGMKLVKRKGVVIGTNETISKFRLPEKTRRNRSKRAPQSECLERSPEQESFDETTLNLTRKARIDLNKQSQKIIKETLVECDFRPELIQTLWQGSHDKRFKFLLGIPNERFHKGQRKLEVKMSLATFLRNLYESTTKYIQIERQMKDDLYEWAGIFDEDEIEIVLAKSKKRGQFCFEKAEIIIEGSNLTIK